MYEQAPRESLAPRGQVYNARALLEGRLEMTAGLADELYQCMACRGCESVCPAGVPVGAIMEKARGLITEAEVEGPWLRRVKRWLLAGVVAHPRRLAGLMSLGRWGQRLGLRALATLLVPRLRGRAGLLPKIPAPRRLASRYEPSGERRGRVALFTGCIATHLFGDVNEATARVLQRNGYEVVVPESQVCCGALHLHNGLPQTARELATRNLAAFEDAGADVVIVNAAGCGAALREYGELLEGEPSASRLADRVRDVSEFLVQEGFRPPGGSPFPAPRRVAYDAPCHLVHAQHVADQPRELLRSIPGVELVAHENAERCCGSAGIYNVTHYDESMAILDVKMDDLVRARPDVIATGNPGCHLQLSEGARREGLDAEVVHPVVLLDRAYRAEPG